jgi:hypothetical protein
MPSSKRSLVLLGLSVLELPPLNRAEQILVSIAGLSGVRRSQPQRRDKLLPCSRFGERRISPETAMTVHLGLRDAGGRATETLFRGKRGERFLRSSARAARSDFAIPSVHRYLLAARQVESMPLCCRVSDSSDDTTHQSSTVANAKLSRCTRKQDANSRMSEAQILGDLLVRAARHRRKNLPLAEHQACKFGHTNGALP